MQTTPNCRAAVALIVLLVAGVVPSHSERSCIVEWSISNSYTIASQQSSYVTLNLYASTNGTEDIVSPYNVTIYNPSYTDAFSWNFEVFSVIEGTIYGETQANNAFWQTLLAGGKNIFNLGGNIETTNLDAPPLIITLDNLTCFLKERQEGAGSGNTTSDAGSGSQSSGTGGSSSGTAAGSSSGGGGSGSGTASGGTGGSSSGTAAGSSSAGAGSGSGSGTASGGTGSSTGGSGLGGIGGATSAPPSPPPGSPAGFIPGVITPPSPRNPGAVPSPPPPPAPVTPGRFPQTNGTEQGKNRTSGGPAPGPAPAQSPYSRFAVLPVLP